MELLTKQKIIKSYFFKKLSWNLVKFFKRTAVDLAHKVYNPSVSTSSVPIMVLHGLLGSKRNWQSMCNMITSSAKRPVIAVDARNHGDSPHADSHTYPELAADVNQLFSTLSIEKASVIGHSMGGRTGMCLALTEPSKVMNLIVVDISPVSTAGILNNFFPRLIDAMKSVNFQGATDINVAKKSAADTILQSGVVENMAGMDFIFMNIGRLPDKSFGWKCNPDALKNHFHDIASFPNKMLDKQFSNPTLFIGGEHSNYIPREDLTGIQKLFPKAELKYVQGVGHNVHAESPNAFLNMVLDFLSKH